MMGNRPLIFNTEESFYLVQVLQSLRFEQEEIQTKQNSNKMSSKVTNKKL